MAKRFLAVLAGLLLGLAAEKAHACSCIQRGGSLLQWDGDKVPRNFPAFVWYGGEPNDGTWLPPRTAFHLERLQQGKPPQPIAVNLERVDSAFPDLTIPDFLRAESVVRGGLLFTKGRDGQEKVWPRSVLVIARPATALMAGASYQIVYDREPIVDMLGESVQAQPPQKIAFKVSNESIPTGDTHASILLGEAKVGPLSVSTRRGSCRTEIVAASRALEFELPTALRKWREFFLYATNIDGIGWRPSQSLCKDIPHGASWMGSGKDLLFAKCSGGAPADNLSEGMHKVEMVAWLPGTKTILRAQASVTLTCVPTKR